MLPSRLTRTAAVVTMTLASAAPAVAAPHQDLRSPDTRDAAEHTRPFYFSFYGSDATHVQDLRSPDTRDAAERYVPPTATSLPRVRADLRARLDRLRLGRRRDRRRDQLRPDAARRRRPHDDHAPPRGHVNVSSRCRS